MSRPRTPPLDHSKRMQWSIDFDDARKALNWLMDQPASNFTVGELLDIHDLSSNFSTIATLRLAVSKGYQRSTEKGNPS